MRHVLILDADDDIRTLLCALLEDEGYRVAAPPDPASVLQHLHTAAEPLILLFDVSLPTEQNKLLLAALVQHPELASRHAYICMTTSSLLSAEVQALLTQLDLPLLVKPFELDDLLGALHTAASAVPANARARQVDD